jgi:hypothetical protein
MPEKSRGAPVSRSATSRRLIRCETRTRSSRAFASPLTTSACISSLNFRPASSRRATGLALANSAMSPSQISRYRRPELFSCRRPGVSRGCCSVRNEPSSVWQRLSLCQASSLLQSTWFLVGMAPQKARVVEPFRLEPSWSWVLPLAWSCSMGMQFLKSFFLKPVDVAPSAPLPALPPELAQFSGRICVVASEGTGGTVSRADRLYS